MFKRTFRFLSSSYGARFLSRNSGVCQRSLYGNVTISIPSVNNQHTKVISLLGYHPMKKKQDHALSVKFPASSSFNLFEEPLTLPVKCTNFNKCVPSLNSHLKRNALRQLQEICINKTEGNEKTIAYSMGSLLKKRRQKMNRQKYKKRRKRDRFKREALKNLRERKRQRKERAEARKQALLSKMIVNKSISNRRARYLSHKLLPGIIKGQGLG